MTTSRCWYEPTVGRWIPGGSAIPIPSGCGARTNERTKRLPQIELLKLQYWVKATGERLIILFEGRDAAGKGGTIKRFMEHLNPRGARVVALEKPSERERTQWYFQGYLAHLPAAGEMVLFDRSWYTRDGVERVMGFCTPAEYQERWDDYTRAKEAIFQHTDTDQAPWAVVKSNDKKRGRVEAMRYVLDRFDYDDKDQDTVGTPDPRIVGSPDEVYDEDRLADQPRAGS
jgi:polyphosphate kinase 2 (PPK2 family)